MMNSKTELFSKIEQYPIHNRFKSLLDRFSNNPKAKVNYNLEEQCYEFGIFKEKTLYYGIRIILLSTKILFSFIDHFISTNITYTCENNIGRNQNVSYNTIFHYEHYQNNIYHQYKETSRFDSNQNEIKKYIRKQYMEQELFETITDHIEYILRIEEKDNVKNYYIYYLSEEEQYKRQTGHFYLPYPIEPIDSITLKGVQKEKR